MKIISSDFVTSGTTIKHYPEDNLPEVLFCGRSNVGKSSLINALVNRKNLARTSSNPGKTQTLNFFIINSKFYLVDAPGYGYAKVSKGKKDSFKIMIDEYLRKRINLKKAFLLVDYRHEPTNDDLDMYQFLKKFDIPVCVIATKRDKLKNSELVKNKKAIINKLQLNENDEFVCSSAEDKYGIEQILGIIEKAIEVK